MNTNSLPALKSELEATFKALSEQREDRLAAESDWHPNLAGGPLDRILKTQAAVALLERRIELLRSKISAIELQNSNNAETKPSTK